MAKINPSLDEIALGVGNGDSSLIRQKKGKGSQTKYCKLLTQADEMIEGGYLLRCMSLELAVRPEGANHQWRKIPPGELSIDPVADERLVRVTAWVGAS
jgi:hypothetical protein